MNIEWMHGPHSQYIMIAYAITLVIVIYCAILPVLRQRALLRHIRLQQRAEKMSRR